MVHQWLLSLSGLILVLPLFLGCGSSSSSSKGSGMSAAELEKMMEADKEEAAKAAASQVTAIELIKSLTADPPAAEAAKAALAGQKRTVKGTIVDRSPEASGSPYLTLDGGTQKDKAYKVKFNFDKDQEGEIASAKVGDTVQIKATSTGALQDDTVEFNDCLYYPQAQQLTPQPPGIPKPDSKSK